MIKKIPPFRLLSGLASLRLTVLGLILFAVLVVWGTLFQVNNGIYAAQERFFRAWFVLVGGVIPFPAVKTVVAVLSVNLLAAAFRRRPLNPRTIGIVTLHIGVAVLIGGSAITSSFVRESAITLAQGQSTDTTYDFTTWQLAVAINGIRDGTPYQKKYRFDFKRLKEGQRIALPPMTAALSFRHLYRNCGAMISPHDSQTVIGLKSLKISKEQGRNIPGIVFSFGADGDRDFAGSTDYYVYAGSPYPVPFAYGNDTIVLSLQPLAIPLPLHVSLSRFTVEWHPGTVKAKSFQSRLRLLGKNLDREVVIEMNRPFRYRSFTFYQMGYSGEEGSYASTLAIVKNPLRYLPYIASCIIVAGLFFHFIMKMWYELSYVRRHGRG